MTQNKVQSSKGESFGSTARENRDQFRYTGGPNDNTFGGDVSTHSFMMGDSSVYSSSHVTVEQYEMMRDNAPASRCTKLTFLLEVKFYALIPCLFFGAKWLF